MPSFLVSPATALVLVVGIAIAYLYLRRGWAALHQAAVTVDAPDDSRTDSFAFSFAGAVIAVIASSAAIAAYGLGPDFLYVGVMLALLSPLAVAYTFARELSD